MISVSVKAHPTIDLAREAGFESAADQAATNLDRAGRLAQAYEHYRFVTKERIDQFNQDLRKATQKDDKYSTTYDTMELTAVRDYHSIPPTDVLKALIEAKARNIFDTYEVAWIKTVREVHDPLLFGLVEGCTDRFFIAQWGDDVKITDLLAEHEG